VSRSARSMVASAIRAVFEKPDERSAPERPGMVIESIRPRFPAVADLLADAEPDLLAHFTFPTAIAASVRTPGWRMRRARANSAGCRAGGRRGPNPVVIGRRIRPIVGGIARVASA